MAPAPSKNKNKSSTPGKALSSSNSNSKQLKTHNVQHTLRAASKQKLAQRQQQAQSAAGKGSSEGTSAKPSTGESSSNNSGKKPAASAPTPQQIPRKQVFKQVLASPLTVNWPVLSNVDAQPILYTLLDVLKHKVVVDCLRSSHGDGKKFKGKAKADDKGKAKEGDTTKPKEQFQGEAKQQDASAAEKQNNPTGEQQSSAASTPSSIILGINSVSRHLESMIDHQARQRREQARAQSSSSTATVPSASTSANTVSEQPLPPSPLNIVFVCRQDLDPPTLCAHFPMLTCAVNAVCHPQPGAGVLLIPLPAGSERLVCEALNLRRCSVVGLSTDVLSSMGVRQPLMALLARIQEAGNSSGLKPLRASWLDSAADVALRTREYLMNRVRRADSDSDSESKLPAPPAVVGKAKQVQSTAPANINAVKLAKKHTRQEKKEWRKAMRKDGHVQSVTKAKRSKTAQRKEKAKRRIEAGKVTIAKKKKKAAQRSSQKNKSSPADVEMKET